MALGEMCIEDDGTIVVHAKCLGSQGRVYHPVIVTLDFARATVLEANCPCPNAHSHCKHVGAILLATIARTDEYGTGEDTVMDQERRRPLAHQRSDYRAPDHNTRRVGLRDICATPQGAVMGSPDSFGNAKEILEEQRSPKTKAKPAPKQPRKGKGATKASKPAPKRT